MSEVKHTPPALDWRHIPSQVAEGPPEVRHADGWLVCETCSDDYAKLISAAPAMLEALAPFAQFEGEDVFWAEDASDDYVWLIHDGLAMTVGMIRAARAAVAKAQDGAA